MIPDEAVEAAARALAEHSGETDWGDWEQGAKAEAVADMRAALEAAAPHLMAAFVSDMLDEMRSWVGDKELGFIEGVIESCEEEATK